MKKHFNKELVMTKRGVAVLRTLLNVGFVMFMLMVMIVK